MPPGAVNITFQLPMGLYIEYTMKLMIIVPDREMGNASRALGYRNAYSIREVFELLPRKAYWLDSCVACIASYTIQSGRALCHVLFKEGSLD